MEGTRNSCKEQFSMLLQWANPSTAVNVATLERTLQISFRINLNSQKEPSAFGFTCACFFQYSSTLDINVI